MLRNYRPSSLQAFCMTFLLAASSVLLANDLPSPTDVRTDGAKLLWDPVEGAVGYNIYLDRDYLSTVRGRTDFNLQIDGFYQITAFDESASQFSSLSDGVAYEVGSSPSVSTDIGERVRVVTTTCRNVNGGETCAVSCGGTNDINVATGGACATSDIVEADATAGPTSYSCTVPTFSGQVTAQVYCLTSKAFR